MQCPMYPAAAAVFILMRDFYSPTLNSTQLNSSLFKSCSTHLLTALYCFDPVTTAVRSVLVTWMSWLKPLHAAAELYQLTFCLRVIVQWKVCNVFKTQTNKLQSGSTVRLVSFDVSEMRQFTRKCSLHQPFWNYLYSYSTCLCTVPCSFSRGLVERVVERVNWAGESAVLCVWL